MNVEVIFDGNYEDEGLVEKVNIVKTKIKRIVESDCDVMKIEPWNSVKVTFSIPREAVMKLKQLAVSDSNQLKELGILSVHIEGEDLIKLSIDAGEGNSQELVLQQQPTIQQQGAPTMHDPLFDPSMMNMTQPVSGPQIFQPVASAPKKRSRRSKDKSNKTSKASQVKPSLPARPADQFARPASLSTNDTMNPNHNPPFNITQLSPSVEQIVSEAWNQEMHHQNPEEDIMGVQLQSLLSGTNVTTGSTQMNPNSTSTFDPHQQPQQMVPKHMQPGISPNHQPLTFAPSNMMMQMRPDLQKQQSVPSSFAPDKMSTDQKVFAPQTGPSIVETMSQLSQDHQAHVSQTMPHTGIVDQVTSQPSPMNNMQGNFRANNLQQGNSNLHQNIQPGNWPPTSMIQQQQNTYKPANNHLPTGNFPMQNNSDMPPGTPGMQGTMPSPGSSVHSGQFPFSFPDSTKGQIGDMRPDKFAAMGQGMSMDSPLLVNLLQNEASAGMGVLPNPPQAQFSSAAPPTPAAANEKPKRKKPARKKKPKSSTITTPTGSNPIQAFGGMYGMQGQFMGQRFAQPDMSGQEQLMQHSNPMMKMNQDPKVPVIETISRSDVGAQAIPFSGNMAISSANGNVRPTGEQLPMFRRHNSMPVTGNPGFAPGFDASKANVFQHKQAAANMSQQQQQMFMNQMSGQYQPQFDPNHVPRPMMMQQMQLQQMMQQQQQQPPGSANKNPGQFQQPFHHVMSQGPMMQHGPSRPQQQFQVGPDNLGGQQMPNPDAFQQPNVDMKHPPGLPTLPPGQPRPMQHHRPSLMQSGRKRRRTSSIGRLPSGSMSIMLKSTCSSSQTSRVTSARFPTLPPAASQQSRPRSSVSSLKSPGSSAESMSFGSPSPKLGHPNTPSPHLQNSQMIRSPSPLTSHGSRSGTPKPHQVGRTNSSKPSSLSRRPSVDQYGVGSPAPGAVNKGFGNTAPLPVNSVSSVPGGLSGSINFKPPEATNKLEERLSPAEVSRLQPGGWLTYPTSGMPPFPWQQGQMPSNQYPRVLPHSVHGVPLNPSGAKPRLPQGQPQVTEQQSLPQAAQKSEMATTPPKCSEPVKASDSSVTLSATTKTDTAVVSASIKTEASISKASG